MFWTEPTCPACGYKGTDFMYLPHGSWGFGVLVQDRESLALRVAAIPGEQSVGKCSEGVSDAEAEQMWVQRMAELANPPLRETERIVPIREFMSAAIESTPTAAELPCPACGAPLHWRATGIS